MDDLALALKNTGHYHPKNDELIITIEALEMSNKVNIVGKVMSNLELLLKARNGLNTKILRV